MKKAIYPNIDFRYWRETEHSKQLHLHASTFLRKKHEGKWYLTFFVERAEIRCDDSAQERDAVAAFLSRLHKKVYNFSIVGVIQADLLLHPYPDFAHEIDSDQREEEERLREVFYVR